MTNDGQKIVLFDAVTQYVASKRDEFAKAIINKLIPFSFEHIFAEKFDFYATLFEYLIKDYNKDGGGKYAEYYTPHAVAKIMAQCLVPKKVKNVTCYDPAAGSGTLLMNLAHQIGEDRCTHLHSGHLAKVIQPVAIESDLEQPCSLNPERDSGQHNP